MSIVSVEGLPRLDRKSSRGSRHSIIPKDQISREGYLTKRGSFFKSWKKRYFILTHSGLLIYYVTKNGKKKGAIQIGAELICEENATEPFCLMITQPTGLKKKKSGSLTTSADYMLLVASNLRDKKDWMRAFASIVASLDNLPRDLNLSIGSVKDTDICTETTDFLKSSVQAISTDHSESVFEGRNPLRFCLTVKIVRARNLRAADNNGLSDPYVRIRVGNSIQQTCVKKENLNPVWNERFEFPFEFQSSPRYVHIEVFDKDDISPDDFLGCADIPTLMMIPNKEITGWYRLGRGMKKGKQRFKGHLGEIELSITMSNNPMKLSAEELLRQIRCIDGFSMKLGWNSAKEEEILMPPAQTEQLEDVASVVMQCSADESVAYSNGVLILTNYRLMFITDSRLLMGSRNIPTSKDLTMQIALGNIMSVDVCSLPNLFENNNNPTSALRIRAYGGRDILFNFLPSTNKDQIKDENEWSPATNLPARLLMKNAESLRIIENRQKNGNSIDTIQKLQVIEFSERPPSHRFNDRLSFYIHNGWTIDGFALRVHQDLIALWHEEALDDDRFNGERLSTTVGRRSKRCSNKSHADKQVILSDDDDSSVPSLDFDSKPSVTITRALKNGWCIYEEEKEFQRLGINSDSLDSRWRLSKANVGFKISSTYPESFVVPQTVDDTVINGCAKFRSKGRLPVLVWRHKTNQTVICRCAQPLPGLLGKRSDDDEKFIQEIIKAVDTSEEDTSDHNTEEPDIDANLDAFPAPPSKLFGFSKSTSTASTGSNHSQQSPSRKEHRKLVLVDCRPKFNAMANQVMGKGTESSKTYEFAKVEFLGIPNIHEMRKSVDASEELSCSNAEKGYDQTLQSVGWISYIRRVLEGACYVTDLIVCQNKSVLVHCSDGWDRTAQITSLSQLFLDPFFRTISGFMVLVDKEWLSFGHKFLERCGRSERGDNERSPIFRQFIEAVAFVLLQKPCAFEFNESFLLTLLEHFNSGWFGNFVMNCVKERQEGRTRSNSISLWTVMEANRDRFTSENYVPDKHTVIFPNTSRRHMSLWKSLWSSWNDCVHDLAWDQRIIGKQDDDHFKADPIALRENYEKLEICLRRRRIAETFKSGTIQSIRS